jgi:hypothetical protein
VNTIWEGSGNVMCLDVLRAIGRDPESIEVLFKDLASTANTDETLQTELQDLFSVFLKTVQALPDEWMRGCVLQLSVRLDKCLAPEWKNLAPVMGAAVKAYSDRVDGPKKAPEEAKLAEAVTAPVVEPVEAPAKPEKAASKVKAKKAA